MSSKGEDADRALLPEQTPFYKDLAAVAVQVGFISNVESSICFCLCIKAQNITRIQTWSLTRPPFFWIHNMMMYNILSVVILIPLIPMILILRTTLVLAGTQMSPLFCNLHFNIQSLYCLKKVSRKDLLPA
jgi:hypothetical protein